MSTIGALGQCTVYIITTHFLFYLTGTCTCRVWLFVQNNNTCTFSCMKVNLVLYNNEYPLTETLDSTYTMYTYIHVQGLARKSLI